MRTLITGDLHLSHNPRDEYRFGFMQWFANLIKVRKPDRVIIAGDLTEEKDRHPSILVNRVVDHVHALAKICPVVVVEGNHDYKDEGHAFFRFLSRIPNTRWIAHPTVLGDMLCLPHTNDYKRDWKYLDLGAYPTIVCHQTFNGASVGFGRELEGIPLNVLPRKSTTFCGDIHVPQEMEQLVYVGAPYHVDFGDNYDARVIELNDAKWKSIDTSSLPQKRAINISAGDDLGGQTCNEGDLVQITVQVETMEGWNTIHGQVEGDAMSRKLRVWSIKPKVMSKAVRRQHKVADARSDRDVLAAYGRRHGLSAGIMKRGEKLL